MENIISKDPKEFALSQIAPYYKDKNLCATHNKICQYLTDDGRMCVAGKVMLPEVRGKYYILDGISPIGGILNDYSQAEIFIPEVVDILTDMQWVYLQGIHDAIALYNDEVILERIGGLNLFTFDELKEYSDNLK